MDDEKDIGKIERVTTAGLSRCKIDRRRLVKRGAAIAGASAFTGPLPGLAEKRQVESLPQIGYLPQSVDPAAGATGAEAARKWVEWLQPSTLSKDQQMAEMRWFIEAAKPYQGMNITAVSGATATHTFEADILSQAFEQITGIRVTHDCISESEVVAKVEAALQTRKAIYDIFVNGADFIGAHGRLGATVSLSEFMRGEGAEVTLPTLDVDDLIGKRFVTWQNTGDMYQLPTGQFANLYWYRKDWFERPDLKKQFKKIYGYELDVPVNWSAYEDIADFFTNKVKHLDGKRVYGHMDYGKKDPSLGGRIHDAWLALAGAGDKGLPNGWPVDAWGIRVDKDLHPRGSVTERGGAVNSPASVYAIRKYVEWLNKYAPPEATGMTLCEAGPVPAQGHIAQQIFWYTAFTASMTQPGLPVVNDDGTPKWRMAPSPHGPYWEPGSKLGYQGVGGWTLLQYTPTKKAKAAWLYAQFCVCKSVSLRKTVAALTPFRESDIQSETMTRAAPYLGGLVEFYRSPARKYWSPTGVNVPAYAKLAPVWWHHIAPAVSGDVSAQEAMDNIGEAMDKTMRRLSRAGVFKRAAPRINDKKSKQYWFDRDGAPKPRLANEDPPGETLAYSQLFKAFDTPSDKF